MVEGEQGSRLGYVGQEYSGLQGTGGLGKRGESL